MPIKAQKLPKSADFSGHCLFIKDVNIGTSTTAKPVIKADFETDV